MKRYTHRLPVRRLLRRLMGRRPRHERDRARMAALGETDQQIVSRSRSQLTQRESTPKV